MKDVVFNHGTLSVYLDVAPDQVKQVVVSRKGGVYGEVFLRQKEDGKDAIPVEWIENEIRIRLGLGGNHFAYFAAIEIEVMLAKWRAQREGKGNGVVGAEE